MTAPATRPTRSFFSIFHPNLSPHDNFKKTHSHPFFSGSNGGGELLTFVINQNKPYTITLDFNCFTTAR
jgi:hypothetical protein